MSRFALLGSNDFGTDGQPTTPPTGHVDPEDTPRQTASQQPTRPPSPTPTLEPLRVPEAWRFNGQEYEQFEDAARVAGQHYNIEEEYVNYIMAMVNDLARKNIIEAYNQLGNKMYEHRNQMAIDIHALRMELGRKVNNTKYREDMDDLEARCHDLEDENEKLKAEIVVVKADADVLNRNLETLVNVIKQLQAQVNTLATQPANSRSQASTSSASSGSRPKIADPPKFKGKTQDLTVEQWFQKLGIWFRYQNILADDDKITTALLFLEGGAQSYMDDYAQKASDGNPLGTWTDFAARLRSGYRELAPEKSAQQSLKEHCAKSHSSLTMFAENFRCFAIKSGYSDVELIRRIKAQCQGNIRTTMITHRSMSPFTVPTRWESFLDWVLSIEIDYRGEKYPCHATLSRTTRDPNAMDIDAMRKPEKLSKEQEDWMAKKLCFHCGKHPAKQGVKCRNPVYKGYYEFPKNKTSTAGTRVRAMDEGHKDQDQDRMEFVINALKEFDQKGKERAQDQETTAQIVEADEQDFLQRM